MGAIRYTPFSLMRLFIKAHDMLLEERLPRHYIPQQFHKHYIPLNRNGKINRDYQQFQSTYYQMSLCLLAPPERAIANIWHKYIPHTTISVSTPHLFAYKETLHFARMISGLNSGTTLSSNTSLYQRFNLYVKKLNAARSNHHPRSRSSIALIGGGPGAIALCHH